MVCHRHSPACYCIPVLKIQLAYCLYRFHMHSRLCRFIIRRLNVCHILMIVPLRRCYIKLLQIQRILADIDILLSDVAGSAVNRTISIIPRSGVIRTCTGPFQTVLDSIGTAVGSNVVEVVNAFITSHITGYRTDIIVELMTTSCFTRDAK